MNIEEFLNTSYTAYHTTANCVKMLEENGFTRLADGVKIEKGGKYYAVKNGSAVIAVNVGDLADYAFNIAECHTDSPVLKVKGNKLLDSPEGKRINVEVYGGLIRYSMMDIPLVIAGRMLVKDGDTLKTELVKSDFCVNIPSLCIHHNPTVNDGFALNPQVDMLPLVCGEESDLYKILAPEKEVVDADLYVVPFVEAYRSGAKGELLCSPRIDNLTSAYASIKGVTACNSKGVAVACCFDNEEIGSHTKQGACSEFLPAILKRVNRDLGYGDEDFYKATQNGFVLSIDNGHAVHPAHPEKSDVAEKVYLNKGIVVKHHANYSTDGFSSAVIKTVLSNNGIKYQDYYNRSDLRCGGTLGLVTSAQLEMNAVDIGLGQLAMHSAIETVGAYDIEEMEKCVTAFFSTALSVENGNVTIK